MPRYAYVYSNETAKIELNVSSMQLTIKEYVSTYLDPIEITSITETFPQTYQVVCLDFFAVYGKWVDLKKMRPYFDILKSCQYLCLLTRDLHTWTFIEKFVEDPFKYTSYKPLISLLKLLNIKTIISIYDCPELYKILELTKCKHYILPLHIDTVIFKNYHWKRDIDVFIYGASLQRVYPLRNRIKQTVKQMKIKSFIVENPSTKTFGKNLAHILNRSWITICTCSVYQYLVLKYFEASACGSVVAGNMPDQGKPIWGQNYIHIPDDATYQQIANIITLALMNKTRLRYMGDHMSEIITSQYNYQIYAKKLYDICENMI